jgi:hypothetical protein
MAHEILMARATLVAAVYPMITGGTARLLSEEELDRLRKIVTQLGGGVEG